MMVMMSPYSYVGCKGFAFQPQNLTTHMKENLVDNIINTVCRFYGIEKRYIIGKSRRDDYKIPRHISIYLCLTLTGIPLTHLGRIYNRHHATIIHSRDYIISQLSNKFDDSIKEDVKTLKMIL